MAIITIFLLFIPIVLPILCSSIVLIALKGERARLDADAYSSYLKVYGTSVPCDVKELFLLQFMLRFRVAEEAIEDVMNFDDKYVPNVMALGLRDGEKGASQ